VSIFSGPDQNWITSVHNRTTGGTTRYDATYYYNDSNLWDHTGNPLKRTENFGGSDFNTTLRYDGVYRLTEETKRDGNNTVYTRTYGYDAVGNRTSMNRDGTSYTYNVDDNDKLTGISGGGQSATLSYDNSGNMTGMSGTMYGSWSLSYDDESRLTSVTYPSGGTSVTDNYYYDAMGHRYRSQLNGTYYRYIYNGDRVLEDTADNGNMIARYTTVSGSYYEPWVHVKYAAGDSRFPLYDAIGTARALVNDSYTVTDTFELDTFGRQVSATGSTPNAYKFGGAWGYRTEGSGLEQLGARFYWPEVGRFVSQDPIGDGMNWYAYVNNRPTKSVDPSGLAAGQSLRRHQGSGSNHGPHIGGSTPRSNPKTQPKGNQQPCPKPKKRNCLKEATSAAFQALATCEIVVDWPLALLISGCVVANIWDGEVLLAPCIEGVLLALEGPCAAWAADAAIRAYTDCKTGR
jgi:RHS repeat-associated protein